MRCQRMPVKRGNFDEITNFAKIQKHCKKKMTNLAKIENLSKFRRRLVVNSRRWQKGYHKK